MTGKDFKEHRKDLRLTREQLARELCVSVYTLDSWETDRRAIPACCEKLFCILYNLPFKGPDKVLDFATINTPDLFPED